MYAARKLYVRNWDGTPEDERYSVDVERGGKAVSGYEPDRITGVEEEVMCWRKANHIHAWFVDNVQNGKDDCDTYHVYWEQLRELLSACEKVIEASDLVDGTIQAGIVYDKEHPDGVAQREPGKVIEDDTVAKKLLPTRSGFFFGGGEYDEDYLQDVIETRDWLKRMLEERAAGVPGDIYYSSSW